MPNPVPVPAIKTPVLTIPRPGFLQLSWVDNSSDQGASKDDALILCIVNEGGVQATPTIVTTAKRSDTSFVGAFAGVIETEDSNLIWAGFMREATKELSAPTTLSVQG